MTTRTTISEVHTPSQTDFDRFARTNTHHLCRYIRRLSRQEEAQRLGRVLRPKGDKRSAHFYTIVTRDTVDADFAAHRQRFLAEQGYAYSSSVAPIVHDHYGWREAPRFAFRPVDGAAMIEIPVTTAEIGGRRMAAGGGGFFRVLPYGFSRWAIRQVNRTEGRPAVFYFHPWEVDPEQPRVGHAPLRSRFRHYTGLARMSGKLRELVHDFRWGRMDLVAHREAARAVDLVLPAPAEDVAA